ncbi:gibberellin-regulated protein 14-like protein [Lates japonicus]|uniref:Gibberellin-regulated protein 14-like protein n=1 Tax=Lates japonicus TaxID=270547 RepID=A0AAD3MUC8_LATJO|nr:gibberellin-regulated protein 14-like protein [Lates japonicus]
MDYIEHVLGLCGTIYKAIENMKANKERCERVIQRLIALEELVLTIKQRGPDQISPNVDKALRELCSTFDFACDVILKYFQTKPVKGFLKSKKP